MKKLYKSFMKLKKRKFKYAVSKGITMIPPVDKTSPIKVAGYLEKRSKMRVVCRWKKFWFVLEGRLLLYYKSQLEYLSLSPCRGTVNLGLAASVAPGKGNEIIVSTRSNTISLRALNRAEHDIWLHALMDALHLPHSTHVSCCTKPVHHFRYSMSPNEHDVLPHGVQSYPRISPNYHLQMENPDRIKRHPSAIDLIQDSKLDRLTHQFNRIATSEISIPGRLMTMGENQNSSILRRSISVEDEVNRYQENIYETVDSNKIRNKGLSKRIIRSDSDCVMTREKGYHHSLFRSEQFLKSAVDSPHQVNKDGFGLGNGYKPTTFRQETPLDRLFRRKISTGFPTRNKDIKSDTDLTNRRHQIMKSGSCIDLTRGTSSVDFKGKSLFDNIYLKTDTIKNIKFIESRNKKINRNDSQLKNTIKMIPKNEIHQPVSKKNSVKIRSLSFLKKIWKRKEPKTDEDFPFKIEENDMQELQHTNSDFEENSSTYSAVELSLDYEPPPVPEPPPDYEQSSVKEEAKADIAPNLPPRKGIRSVSPAHDVPTNNQPLDVPPALPVKKRKMIKAEPNCLDFLFEESWAPGLRRLFQEEGENELNEIMRQLAGLNNTFCQITSIENDYNEDPDYDIPRPHASLLPNLMAQSYPTDIMPATNFFSQFEDSLDLIREEDLTMAPDSLECDSWSLSEEDMKTVWIPEGRSRKSILASQYGLATTEHYFEDSLNPPFAGKDYMSGYILHT